MHADKKRRVKMTRGRKIAGKVAVMALLERHGQPSSQVQLHVLHTLKRHEVQTIVRDRVEAGSNVYSDAFASYTGLIADYSHKVIDHAEAYVDGKFTPIAARTSGALKRAIKERIFRSNRFRPLPR
jgi:hypothetical protein